MPASSHTSRASAAIVSCARERSVSSASGSIIVAEMREMTSPPKGCWALSSDWTGERLAGLEVEQRGHHRGGAEVEGERVAGARRVARLDVDHLLVDDDRGDLEARGAQDAAELAHDVQRDVGLEVVDGVEQALHVRALVLHRRLVELDVALDHRGAQDHVAPDADQRRLGPRLQRAGR